MRYSPKFYKDLLAPEGTTEYTYDPKFLKFAHYQGFTVGAVCARMEVDENQERKYKLYIMIMNVLAAYRRRGQSGWQQQPYSRVDHIGGETALVGRYAHE